ncbi:type II secretion system F family protein [Clostridium fungisolvens]|uniref:Type II secretion system protein F n=1 Tax=Clostridium fungisolvens TaxID=1604897 RepID=A0A6V8SIZ4_9CLOT|nr:type II secretion system F family protein [Clostridium fungisolvens]GFP76721.1 Type II secretion system protein F [Clostridium fungisolvens]
MTRNKVKYDCIIRISSDLSMLLGSGISIFNAFKILSSSVSDKKYKFILNKIVEKIHGGCSLADAFQEYTEYFPELYIQMIHIGEASGNLSTVLEELSSYYTIRRDVKKKVINVSIYPIILVFTLITMLIFYVQVISTAVGEFVQGSGGSVPWYTKNILSICNFIRENNLLVFLSFVCWSCVLILLFNLISKNKLFFSIVSKNKLMRNFKEVLEIEALLLITKCGLPLVLGLEILIDIFNNSKVKYCFNDIKISINNGMNLSAAFYNIGTFSELSLNMITIGEESGKLDYALEKLKSMLVSNLQKNIETLTSFIQPILILVIGVLVCFLILIMMVPIYSSMNI